MSQRKNKEIENIENLCPIVRKRKQYNKYSTLSIVKLTSTESASSPTALPNDLLEEIGMGMLDSEESSSSAASSNTLSVLRNTSDENSNEATPNLLAPKLLHQERLNTSQISNTSLMDTTLDTSSDSNNSFNITAIEVYNDSERPVQQQQKMSVEKLNKLQSSCSPNSSIKKTRNPLANVTCSNQHGNNNNNNIEQIVTPHSPQLSCAPSTSKQALLRKPQQLLIQPPLKHHKSHQTQSSNPAEQFFLYRLHPNNNISPKLQALLKASNHFDKLSDEMILHVFKWLPKKVLLRCGSVCRRFNRCAKDESLWLRLDLGGKCMRPGALEELLTRGVAILRLAQAQIKDPAFSTQFEQSNIQLRLAYLDLSCTTISKQSLKILVAHCRNLKKLSLEHDELDNDICAEIAKNKNLEALNLAMCSGLEAWGVRHMLENLQNLNSFNISWTYMQSDAVTALVTHLTPNIMRLNAAGCRKTLFDSHVATLARRCSQLIELDLSDCSSLTNDVIFSICKFKMLEYLSLSRCYLITAVAYGELRRLHTLTYLDVFGMLTDNARCLLERNLPNMGINKFIHSSVARPTVGTRRTSIWGLRTRD